MMEQLRGIGAAEFAQRLGVVAAGIRATQLQRTTQRRAAKIRAAQVWEELAILREELCSLKTKLRRCGVDLFQDVAEGLEGVALLAAEQGQQAAQQGASVSFAVYLCSRKHTAKELNTCAWISKHGLRDCLKEIKDKLCREQRLLKRDAQRILEAIRRSAVHVAQTQSATPASTDALLQQEALTRAKEVLTQEKEALLREKLQLQLDAAKHTQEFECLVRAKAELKRENEMLLHQKGFLSQISAQHIVELQTELWKLLAEKMAPAEAEGKCLNHKRQRETLEEDVTEADTTWPHKSPFAPARPEAPSEHGPPSHRTLLCAPRIVWSSRFARDLQGSGD